MTLKNVASKQKFKKNNLERGNLIWFPHNHLKKIILFIYFADLCLFCYLYSDYALCFVIWDLEALRNGLILRK